MTDAVENPYFDAVAGGVTVGQYRGSFSDRAIEVLRRRDELVQEYAWAIPNAPAIRTLVDHDPVLEVGAGNGYWASLVEQAGGDIIATDSLQDVDGEPDSWTTVEQLDARNAIREYGEGRTLFICWPNYGDHWAYNATVEYASIGGECLVYVGEGRSGCTGDEAFHQLLHDAWTLAETVAIPTYLGLHDRLEVWSR